MGEFGPLVNVGDCAWLFAADLALRCAYETSFHVGDKRTSHRNVYGNGRRHSSGFSPFVAAKLPIAAPWPFSLLPAEHIPIWA